ncbi:Integrase core domain-containing protein [Shimia marina]|uniref:Integrase core domain protein n=1 Tax=Shimia marina TaxID=321267 RepID=A0A0P1EUY2_9RHOB|nr:Integrase core domain protein [Shimia marina]SFE03730.1 Integrase core domain-containing protein [Shimia marina]
MADTSLSGLRVTRELDRLIAERGVPCTIVSDNGTEFTSMAVLRWVQETSIDWHYIAPGKPTQNAFIERFNGKADMGERANLVFLSGKRSPKPCGVDVPTLAFWSRNKLKG